METLTDDRAVARDEVASDLLAHGRQLDGCTYRRGLVIERRPVAVTRAGGPDVPRLAVVLSSVRLAPSADSIVTGLLARLLWLLARLLWLLARLLWLLPRLLLVQTDLSGFYTRAARDCALGSLAHR